MPFKKNQSGNLLGRPKGTPNVVTGQIRKILAEFLEDKVNELPKIFDQLEPEQKIDALMKIASYVVPKLSATTIEAGMTIERFLEMSDAEREEYLLAIKSGANNENINTKFIN